MGYDLHITRRKNWVDEEGPEISPFEWAVCVANDPELTFDGELGEHVAVWSGPSEHEIPWLEWHGGNISTKNPDLALLGKMVRIAELLAAQTMGDDGEIYADDSGNPVAPTQPPLTPAAPSPQQGFWQRLRDLFRG